MMSADIEKFLGVLRATLTPQEYRRALTMAAAIIDHMATFDRDGVRLQLTAIVLASVLYADQADIVRDRRTNARQN